MFLSLLTGKSARRDGRDTSDDIVEAVLASSGSLWWGHG